MTCFCILNWYLYSALVFELIKTKCIILNGIVFFGLVFLVTILSILLCKDNAVLSLTKYLKIIEYIYAQQWRRERLPTPVFLPREFHRQKSVVGYSPCGHKESDTTEQLYSLHQSVNLVKSQDTKSKHRNHLHSYTLTTKIRKRN